MEFQGPAARDLANVCALNQAFLDVLRNADEQSMRAPSTSDGLVKKLVALGTRRSDRLAECPFLLFALAESEEWRWARLFDEEKPADMIDRLERPPEAAARLAAAALGFLWELAMRNPYAARLVSGASLSWCEQLSDSSPVRLFRFAAIEPNLLTPRLANRSEFWAKLLDAGSSQEKEIRHAAQLCALQTVLTRQMSERYRQLPAAACSTPAPAMRVADRRRRPPED